MAPPERSQRLDVDRPARLRRIAERVEAQAQRTDDPAAAVAIARAMRVRATQLEVDDDDGFETAQRFIQMLGGED